MNHTYKHYNDLTIIQKINAKANRIAAHKRYNMSNDLTDWYPIYMISAKYKFESTDYNTPFKYNLPPFTKK